ncbi:MAG: DUF4962 domain-containing protein, partial [Spirochaetales bacterium]|nr:DUF4962 domain-containing protein [Spirochaetales bacterium]
MSDYIFIEKDIEQLKKELSGKSKFLYDRLVKQCDTYFSVELPDEHPPASSTYMGIAIANLALAALVTEDSRYRDEAIRWMATVTSYPHWGNAHLVDVDLSAAWILFGLGIGYDWLRDELDEEFKLKVKDKLILQGTRMYDFKIETVGSGWSTNYWQNHNWINMCGLASAGYALVKEDATFKTWTDEALDNFDYVYSVMPEDGSDYEGVVYWRYGAMWLFVYAHLVKEREGKDYFSSCGFLENTFTYRLYQAAPNLEEQMNFGDAHDRRSGHSTAIYYKTAAAYNNPYAQKMGNLVVNEFLEREAEGSKVKPGILPEVFFEVMFYDPEVEEKDFDDLPLTQYFDDLGLFTHRTSWDRDSTLFTFKCALPGGKKQWDLLWKLKEEKNYNCFGLSHQHPDNNSFLLCSENQFFAIDDGYNRSVRAADHNVITVDGKGYTDEGQNNIWKNYTKDMVPEFKVSNIGEDYFHLAGETAAVYDKSLNLKKFTRNVLNSGKGFYVLIDELDSSDEHIYTWQMYSDVFPQVDGTLASYDVNGKKMELYSFADKETEVNTHTNTVRAVMTTQEPDKFTETNMRGLCVSNKVATKTMRFATLILPRPEDFADRKVEKIEEDSVFGISFACSEGSDVFLHFSAGEGEYEGEKFSSSFGLLTIKDGKIVR